MAGPNRAASENQFERLLGQGARRDNEASMEDLMLDMMSQKKSHSRFLGAKGRESSKEYQDVQRALTNVVMITSGSFTNDVRANDKMVTEAMGGYYKLLAACEKYLNKKGPRTDSGRARRAKIEEIQRYAQRDLEGIEQVVYVMKGASGEEQATLSWDEIFHSARMETIEVDDYSDTKLNVGGAAKTGDEIGKRLKEGFFAPNYKKKDIHDSEGGLSFINSFYDRNLADTDTFTNLATNTANRNVATSRVANLIGLGGIVEQSKNVKVHDKATNTTKTGSLMSKAKGVEVLDTIRNEFYDKMKPMKSVEERESMAKGVFTPTLQKELCSLQVLDYLCGQGDRHRANIFAERDKEGRFTHIHAIDNDNAFTKGVDAEDLLRNQKDGYYASPQHGRMVVDSKGNLTIPHMDKQLAKNILDLKPDELRFALKDLLEDPFIELTIKRLEMLKKGIQNEMGKKDSTVFMEDSDWNDATYEEFMNQSYRRKIMSHREGEDAFAAKYFFYNTFSKDERMEMSWGDSYIATFVDDMTGFLRDNSYYMDNNMLDKEQLKANKKKK